MKRTLALLAIPMTFACGFDRTVLERKAGASDAGAGVVAPYALAAGWSQGCTIEGGELSCWGDYAWDDTVGASSHLHLTPVRLASQLAFESVAVGRQHACARQAGSVYCWGLNNKGQLGLSDTTERDAPTLVSGIPSASQVSVGYTHSCAVTVGGALYCWGSNDWGELAAAPFGDTYFSATPRQIGTETDWLSAAGAQYHTCGLRAPGSLWCWGVNDDGRVGLGVTSGAPITEPTQVGTETNWAMLDGGQNDACGVRSDGTLWCWGTSSFDNRQVTAPEPVGTDTDWVAVSLDAFNRCGIKRDHSLWCWGRNLEGQLGLGDTTDRPDPTRVPNVGKVLSVAVGRLFICALNESGQILCSGENHAGTLGLGDQLQRNEMTPISL